jgi:hypothetical protein
MSWGSAEMLARSICWLDYSFLSADFQFFPNSNATIIGAFPDILVWDPFFRNANIQYVQDAPVPEPSTLGLIGLGLLGLGAMKRRRRFS